MEHPLSNIVIYDDRCILCNRIFKFIVARQNLDHPIYFTSSDSLCALTLFRKYNIRFENHTVYYFRKKYLYEKSRAVKFILKDIGRFYSLLAFLISLVPSFILNKMYDYVAKNRYRWFGKNMICDINDNMKQLMVTDCEFEFI